MYICICNAVTESRIRQAVTDGARSLRDLSYSTGCSTQCGRCVGTARELLDDALAEIGAASGPVGLKVVGSG